MAELNGKKIVFSPHIHIEEPRPLIITFQGEREFTMSRETLSSMFDAIYYSYDKENWTEWDGSSDLTSQNNVIYILCE